MSNSLRKGKVLIDWSQNSEKKTTVCVYSMRAKQPEPFVSLPFTWDELKRAVRDSDSQSLYHSPESAIKRVKRRGDIFAPVLRRRQKLPAYTEEELVDSILKHESRMRSKRTEAPSTLVEYRRKRHLERTPEPGAEVRSSQEGSMFVVQKHAASHLHYDFRLEMNGVLKSWAVPKGPPLNAKERRLAMAVEDHPLDYAHFEGNIPPGNYGAGTVMVWDRGTYECPEGNSSGAYHRGKLVVELHGEKLKGRWHLIRDKTDPKKWLMIMDPRTKLRIGKRKLERSILSGRTLEQIADDNDAHWETHRQARSTGRKRRGT
jgi:bifunctional non-homologous end joining protein LigD